MPRVSMQNEHWLHAPVIAVDDFWLASAKALLSGQVRTVGFCSVEKLRSSITLVFLLLQNAVCTFEMGNLLRRQDL